METGKKVAGTMAAVVALGALTLGTAALRPVAAQAPPPPPIMRRTERHPEMRRALRNLNQAKNNLQRAQHDLGGHREQALDLVQRAIDQCQQALQDDRH